MAQGEPRRRASDSLIAAAGEAMAAGYRVSDHLVEGFNESVRRRSAPRFAPASTMRPRTTASAAGSARTGRAARGQRATPPPSAADPARPSIVGEFADFTADVLDRMGEAARDIAGHIAERDLHEEPSDVPRLELEGVPGRLVEGDFWFRNTGGTALKQVAFQATHLLGAGRGIDARAVSFEHDGKDHIERIPPGGLTWVTVAVDIPEAAAPDTYRGVLAAGSPPKADRRDYEGAPVGAWALLELEVLATDRRHR